MLLFPMKQLQLNAVQLNNYIERKSLKFTKYERSLHEMLEGLWVGLKHIFSLLHGGASSSSSSYFSNDTYTQRTRQGHHR